MSNNVQCGNTVSRRINASRQRAEIRSFDIERTPRENLIDAQNKYGTTYSPGQSIFRFDIKYSYSPLQRVVNVRVLDFCGWTFTVVNITPFIEQKEYTNTVPLDTSGYVVLSVVFSCRIPSEVIEKVFRSICQLYRNQRHGIELKNLRGVEKNNRLATFSDNYI